MSDGEGDQERPAPTVETVEQLVRQRLAEAFGGVRGIVEAAVPTATFTVCYLVSRDLKAALIIATVLTGILLIVRVVQRSNPQFVLNALVGIAIAAIFASRTGEARDVFLPGIIYNAGYAVVLIVTVAIGWPAIGFMIGALVGDLSSWRADPGMRRLCNRLTLLFALPCVVRVVVQYPLYAADQIAWLGASKIVMGWPLQIAALLAMVWLLSRNSTPLGDVPDDRRGD